MTQDPTERKINTAFKRQAIAIEPRVKEENTEAFFFV